MNDKNTPSAHYNSQTPQSRELDRLTNLPSFQEKLHQKMALLGISGVGVVAVSGGADSVALLCGLKHRYPLVVAHLNHGLRGEESDEDAHFVQQLSTCWGLPVRIEKTTLPQNAPDGLEALARNVRYEFLQRVAAEVQANWIATAHTANDQAETLLHRLIRGTGVQGLVGIRLVRPLPNGMKIIRPMLECTRDEVLDYLKAIPQNYREDSSNNALDFTRNRIRHQILPLLLEENPSLFRTIQNLATQAGEFNEVEQWCAQQLWARVPIQQNESGYIIPRGVLEDCPLPVIRHFWRSFWHREKWSVAQMTFAHWQRLALGTKTGQLPTTDFPDSIRVKCTLKRVKIQKLGTSNA